MKKLISKFNLFLTVPLLLGIAFSVITVVNAVTPNPGHPWSETGDGVFAVTGPTAPRTYTLPDTNATILTNNTAVTIAQGGTGQTTANTAFNALAPTQTSNSGKFLTTNGTDTSWATAYGPTTDSISSANLAGSLSNETGSGAAVFGTSPTFTTSIVDPLIIGGTGTTSTLTLRSTSGVGALGSDIILQVGDNGGRTVAKFFNDGHIDLGHTIGSHGSMVNLHGDPNGSTPGRVGFIDVLEAGINTVSNGFMVSYDKTLGRMDYTFDIPSGGGGLAIGTTAPTKPTATLDVLGNAKISSSLAVNSNLTVASGLAVGGGSSGTFAHISVPSAYNGTIFQTFIQGVSNGFTITNNASNNLTYSMLTGVGTEQGFYQDGSGKVGIGTASPTAVLNLKAGTATANTAPLKFTSGVLLTTPEAGAVEFLTDAYYGTITTGATRKQFAFTDSNITGSAATLTTSRNIYGGAFNGSADVSGIIASTYGGTGNGFTKFSGPTTSEKTFTLPDSSATLLYSGGALGTPSSGVATNLTGTASGLTAGNVTTNANLTGPITSVGNATSVASQTGTGNTFVMNTSPTLVTPNIGIATGTNLALTSTNTVENTTSSALVLNANSLTTGTGIYTASSSLTSGKLIDVQVSGTAAAASQTALNILTTGANATGGIATYGAQISNTHSTNTSTNIALYLNASGGATANYGLVVNAGKVGLGTTAPAQQLDVLDASSAQLRLTQTASSVYSELQTDATGDLIISATGSDIRAQDNNLWVCSGGSCAPSDPAEHGNIIVETSVILNNNFRLKQTGATTVDMLDSGANVIVEFDEAS